MMRRGMADLGSGGGGGGSRRARGKRCGHGREELWRRSKCEERKGSRREEEREAAALGEVVGVGGGAEEDGGLAAVMAVVAGRRSSDCGGAEYARDKGIPVVVFPRRKDGQDVFSIEDLVITLRSYKVDFILLAGYLKLIPVELVQAYPKSILNIHPSLLPAFGGKGYYGMKAVPVLANDTAEELAARVLHEEHKLYVEVAAALCEERITWREDGVPLIRSKENPNDLF
ncbi:Phosphoribosylglycinamide formyltransferase, chloroplastic [Sesamum angolense]|uniref:phosphoribosylglycinamide formyltransferase 1 n=1 Tax=Sesamum angolense TaxID=2727404 RepID=A0AAE1W4L6_9LAMI|nr:Phosphoribosylglycinamide formyltransferase, chloroplastic [Sesamum angolense]